MDDAQRGTITDATVTQYFTALKDEYRSPSRGGNTTVRHQHRVEIDGQWYSWLAAGSRKWIYAGDRVSFDYVVTPEGYRNVQPETIRTADREGREVVRGNRDPAPKRRTAQQRLPARRRDWND